MREMRVEKKKEKKNIMMKWTMMMSSMTMKRKITARSSCKNESKTEGRGNVSSVRKHFNQKSCLRGQQEENE